MKANMRFIGSAVAAAIFLGTSVVVSGNASAELLSDAWRFRAVIYMWAPKITGNVTFPGGGVAPAGETEAVIDVSFKELIDHLKMTGMGTLEAQKGYWGAFTVTGIAVAVIGWLYVFGGRSGARQFGPASVLDRVVLVPAVLAPLAIAGVFPHTLGAFAILDPSLGISAWVLHSRKK